MKGEVSSQPTPGTPIDENHPGLCHRAHPGVRHGEWERKRRGLPPFRRAVIGEDAYCDLTSTIDPGDEE